MRELKDIQAEYANLCGQLGELAHKLDREIPKVVAEIENKIKELKDKIDGVKQEHVDTALAQQKAAAEASAAAQPDAPVAQGNA